MATSLRPWVVVVALVALVTAMEDEDMPLSYVAVENGERCGAWGNFDYCPGDAFATGLQLKIQPEQGFFGDDTGLNAVRLICKGGGLTTSTMAQSGVWIPALRCPPGEHIVAFRLRVEEPQGIFDDSAANDMAVLCSGGKRLQGSASHRGTWGGWSPRCRPSWGVCGLRTRVEVGDTSNTGVNNVQLACCPRPGSDGV